MATTSTLKNSRTGYGQSELQFVAFKLGNQDYAIHVSDVQGIYNGLAMIPNGDLPDFMDGEITLAEERVPVLSLRRFSGMAEAYADTKRGSILLLEYDGMPVGLKVDRVLEVLRLPAQSIETLKRLPDSPVKKYVTAVLHSKSGELLLLDFSHLISDAIH